MLNQICTVTSCVPFPGSESGGHMHVEKEGHKYCVILCSNGAIKNTPEVRLMAMKLLETIQWRGRSLGRLP